MQAIPVRSARPRHQTRDVGLAAGQLVSEWACLSPNAGEKPPSDPRGVMRIARKLHLKDSIFSDDAIEQKRQAEGQKKRDCQPRPERGSACRHNQNPCGVSGMADEGVGSRRDDLLAAVGLDANNRGEKIGSRAWPIVLRRNPPRP